MRRLHLGANPFSVRSRSQTEDGREQAGLNDHRALGSRPKGDRGRTGAWSMCSSGDGVFDNTFKSLREGLDGGHVLVKATIHKTHATVDALGLPIRTAFPPASESTPRRHPQAARQSQSPAHACSGFACQTNGVHAAELSAKRSPSSTRTERTWRRKATGQAMDGITGWDHKNAVWP